jgi:cohesin loading factor subunit SCC2
MTCVVWAQELHGVIAKLDSVVEKLAVEKDEDAILEREKLQVICQTFKSASRDVWQADDRLFETKSVIYPFSLIQKLICRDPRQSENALQASIALARGRPLQSAFDPILRAIGASLDSTVVALRSKALRALGSIVTVDPDVLALVSTSASSGSKLTASHSSKKHWKIDYRTDHPLYVI